jgi:hypothetical protein
MAPPCWSFREMSAAHGDTEKSASGHRENELRRLPKRGSRLAANRGLGERAFGGAAHESARGRFP